MNNKNVEISIALCTLEGSAYLGEQLNSLANQSLLPNELVVCDDNSKDNTVEILREFAKRAPFAVRIMVNKERLGVVSNFNQAISLCQGEYIALCDQDDIWLADRLKLMIEAISLKCNIEKPEPLLVHSDTSIIDINGTVISDSYMKARNLRPLFEPAIKGLSVQNFVTGNTVLFNKALKDLALPIPAEAIVHDWWLALVAATTGSIIYEPTVTVRYRKHGKNVIGPSCFYSLQNLLRLLKMESLENEFAATVNQVAALRDRLRQLGFAERYPYIDYYLAAVNYGGVKALKGVIKSGVKKPGLARNLLFYLLLLKGRYKDELSDRKE